MKAPFCSTKALLLASVLIVTGCMSWQADWPETGPAVPAPDVGALLGEAFAIGRTLEGK